MAFVQHMVASLSDTGRMAVVLPNGALFRARNEEAVRHDLVKDDLVEAVIQMPKDMFYGAGIPACYLVLNKSKRDSRRGRVLFVNASECFERVETKNVLRLEDINRVVKAFEDDDEQAGFSSWASNEAIAARRCNLTARRYVGGANSDETEQITLAEAIAELRVTREERREAETKLDELLDEIEVEGNGV